MDIQTTVYIQIIADVVLCLTIAFLLLRLRKILNKATSPVIDEESLLQFRQLLAESKNDGERLCRTIDESYRKFYELAIGLEAREERLRILVEEIKRRTEAADIREISGDDLSCKKKYEDILNFLKKGLPMEEIAERTDTTSGEILLIAELEKIKQRKYQAG
jgi:hypothetical protein